jgi:hypothetical protein
MESASDSGRDSTGVRVGIRVSYLDEMGLIFVVGMTIRGVVTGFRMIPMMD